MSSTLANPYPSQNKVRYFSSFLLSKTRTKSKGRRMGARVLGMETNNGALSCNSWTTSNPGEEEEMELRRGPWTVKEDLVLIKYIESHGEGRWNSLARCSGLKRTGKSCRLRWLNYLRPDVRRGNIAPEEQLLILELHSRFGNRWSRIAQHLPGRTDNEIKNYWRTRVQKHAKKLQCDVNSKKFKDIMHYLWMPCLRERIRAASGSCPSLLPACSGGQEPGHSPESSSSDARFSSPPVAESADDYNGFKGGEISSGEQMPGAEYGNGVVQMQSPGGYCNQRLSEFEQWDMGGNLWNHEDIWF